MGGDAALRTRATGPLVALTPHAVTVADLQPGDLVFVGAEDTALGAMVTELDGCGFSHVGVLGDDAEPTLLSARTDRHGNARSPDLGGVRRNRLEDLVGRGLFAAPLALCTEVRERGMERIGRWVEKDGPDPDSRSRFSYAKLIAVAVALAAVRRRRPLDEDDAEDLWEAAWRVARRLPWEEPYPGFYCAELIAAMYDLDFDVDTFWVVDGEPHPIGVGPFLPDEPPAPVVSEDAPADVVDLTDPPAPPADDDLMEVIGDLRRAAEQMGLSPAQAFAVARLAADAIFHDRRLAWSLLTAAGELRGRVVGHEPTLPPPGPFTPPDFLERFRGVPLPTALVTPRMLLSSSVVSSVHPLALG